MLNQPISGNDMARFSGPQTFMRLPETNNPEGLDVCLMGVPIDIGTSWRSGTRFGPKQIRQESAMIRPYNLQTGCGCHILCLHHQAVEPVDLNKQYDHHS